MPAPFRRNGRTSAEQAGRRLTLTKNMNKEVRPLTQEQRKEFVQLIKDAKSRILENFRDTYWKRQEKAKDAAREDLLSRIGAADAAKKCKEARKTIKEAESALGKLGVSIDSYGRISFTGDHEDEYDAEISEKASEVLEAQKEESRKTYERAILNVLATDNVDEAKAIVEPLV
jgi:hypothetical protein